MRSDEDQERRGAAHETGHGHGSNAGTDDGGRIAGEVRGRARGGGEVEGDDVDQSVCHLRCRSQLAGGLAVVLR